MANTVPRFLSSTFDLEHEASRMSSLLDDTLGYILDYAALLGP